MTNHLFWAGPSRAFGATVLSGILWISLPDGANAAIVETSEIDNSYNYWVGNSANPITTTVDKATAGESGSVHTIYQGSDNFTSKFGLDYTSTLDENGSFYFLHNAYCVGSCGFSITTNIIFYLKNDGTTPESLRFDSLITPGHLASMLELTRDYDARFDFTITQFDSQDYGNGSAPTNGQLLYSASGTTTPIPTVTEKTYPPGSTSSSDLNNSFNGWTEQGSRAAGWFATDWSATNLNVNLNAIAGGATAVLVYTSTLGINVERDTCTTLSFCEGYQAAFGDPRNNGGGTINQRMASPSGADETVSVIGAKFDPYEVPYAFVPQGSPLPEEQPPVIRRITYTPPFGAAVPEPGIWLMMILGFALLGGAMRQARGNPIRPHRHATDQSS